MFLKNTVLSFLCLSGTALAVDAPSYSGYTKVWQDNFAGAAGSSPDSGKWNIIKGYLNVNAELEVYTDSNRNVQRSGGNTLQLVPWRDGSVQNGWTSGRVESKYTLTPKANAKTRVEASIRFGTHPIGNKQGIWPAFWMLGNSLRNGGSWPSCGEVDIMETVNGQLTGYGTVHCDKYPGGICNEGTGIGSNTAFPNQDWHTWRVEFDRKANWKDEKITWFMDGKQFHQVTGSRINNEGVWNNLCRKPLYFILNVAVGGSWPGYPNGNTKDGYGSMMEVRYVAHYTT